MSTAHHCHAHGCQAETPPRMLMCKPHWASLPKHVQDTVCREYRSGQERDKRPSFRYMAVQRFAVALTAFRPHDEDSAISTLYYLGLAIRWQNKAIAAGLGDPLEGLTAP